MPYIVYVIELDESIMDDKRWVKYNPKQRDRECYYVGQSSHSAECRFGQHRTTHGTEFLCICDKRRGEPVNPYSIGTAKFASDEGKAIRLRPDKCQHLGEFDTADDAKDAEKKLTRELQKQGHGAYSR